MSDWSMLLNTERRDPATARDKAALRMEGREEMERDYDKILYSTPIRRLADKTQVFPLEAHDAVRTRLTHSHEVSTLARSIGIDLASRFSKPLGLPKNPGFQRNLSALMATVGLAHDLGNPPFGHQGEKAIGRWFRKREAEVFGDGVGVDDEMRQDFLQFEGNAQTFRLVTRLQIRRGEYGLNLTYGTLAALLKYAVRASTADENSKVSARKKPGFFLSEQTIVKDVWSKTGLGEGLRHPLTFLIEACDDIAYSVMDIEDAVKKDLLSYADVRTFLEQAAKSSPTKAKQRVVTRVLQYVDKRRSALQRGPDEVSPPELDDLSMQYFRASAISQMVRAVINAFVERRETWHACALEDDLIANSDAAVLRDSLKDLLKTNVFSHRSVLEIELRGANALEELMDKLWAAIVDRSDHADPTSKRSNPLSRYTYGRISENYRRLFERPSNSLPMRYREAQLLTDMMSGMTDSYAMSLLHDLKEFER